MRKCVCVVVYRAAIETFWADPHSIETQQQDLSASVDDNSKDSALHSSDKKVATARPQEQHIDPAQEHMLDLLQSYAPRLSLIHI